MYIKKIELNDFRNYTKQEVELSKGINVFYGDNGEGKTNIIESIFLCSLGKSFRTSKEKELIQLGKTESSVTIEYQKKDREGKIKVDLKDKKYVYVNQIRIKKLSELLGNIHIVIFTPDDIHILKDGPQKRRRFLDIMIGQLRPNYVSNLNLYMKVLEQRNNYLKQIKFENKQEDLLDIWDEKLIEYGEKIFLYRKEFMDKIKNKIDIIHKNITGQKENLRIEYLSDSKNKEEYRKILKQHRKIDIIKGFTTKGIHRDDFMIYINDELVNVYGSQGQNRTVILSLKIAELEVILEDIGEYPILLLDDFMSELDEKRRTNFLSYIKDTQVIITCTDKLEIPNLSYNLYKINKGKMIEKTQRN
ncbi:MAG: DNA replication/repair protein RecF [Clostridia bacterium]